MNPDIVTASLWVAWIVSWWAAAFWRDRAVKRPSAIGEVAHRVIVIAGALLLFNAYRKDSWRLMLWTPGQPLKWTMVALVAVGLLFTWWARSDRCRPCSARR